MDKKSLGYISLLFSGEEELKKEKDV